MWLWGRFCLQMGVTRIILLTTNRHEENGTRNGNLDLKFERYGKAANPALFYSLGDITWIDFLYPADGGRRWQADGGEFGERCQY